MLRRTPEQTVFDWKRSLELDGEEKKSEFLKDVVSMANVHPKQEAYVFYGVDPDGDEPIVGLSQSFDDANFQQLANGKFDPPIDFLYYEVAFDDKHVGVLQLPGYTGVPHFVAKSFGKLKEGQVLVRQGSSTRAMSRKELFSVMYGNSSPYLSKILEQYMVHAMQEKNQIDKLRIVSQLARERREEFDKLWNL